MRVLIYLFLALTGLAKVAQGGVTFAPRKEHGHRKLRPIRGSNSNGHRLRTLKGRMEKKAKMNKSSNLRMDKKAKMNKSSNVPKKGKKQPVRIDNKKLYELQHKWWNWVICNDAFSSNYSFTSTYELFPKNTVFLTGGSPGECMQVVERSGVINKRTDTIFLPLVIEAQFDFTDDPEAGICAATPEEAEENRIVAAAAGNTTFTSDAVVSSLYASLNGASLSSFYLYDDSKFFLNSCPDGRLCPADNCDVPQQTDCSVVDFYPVFGWWVLVENLDLNTGDVLVFEFGSTDPTFCVGTKYTLTVGSMGSGPNHN